MFRCTRKSLGTCLNIHLTRRWIKRINKNIPCYVRTGKITIITFNKSIFVFKTCKYQTYIYCILNGICRSTFRGKYCNTIKTSFATKKWIVKEVYSFLDSKIRFALKICPFVQLLQIEGYSTKFENILLFPKGFFDEWLSLKFKWYFIRKYT